MKAVIMAGGEGTRLRPLTCTAPKPLAPILGKPVLLGVLDKLYALGLREVTLTLKYKPTEILTLFPDGEYRGMTVNYCIEEEYLGTAGGVKNAVGTPEETVLVLSGDAYFEFDLESAYKAHLDSKKAVTMLLKKMEDPREYGVVYLKANGEVAGFSEKPGWEKTATDTVNTGIYFLEPSVFDYIPEGASFDFGKDLFPLLLRKKQSINGVVLTDYWCDIGDIESFRRVQFDLLGEKTAFVPERVAEGVFTESAIPTGDFLLVPPVWFGKNVQIESGAVIGPDAVIGDGCLISHGTKVRESVLLSNVYLSSGCSINGALLCEGVSVKRGSSVFEGAVLGAEVIVGEDSVISNNCLVWPGKTIEDGSVVSENIKYSASQSGSMLLDSRIFGDFGVELTPEKAARFGAALGSLSGGIRVGVGIDGEINSLALKCGILGGLISSGAKSFDFGKCFHSQMFYYSSFCALDLGVFIGGGDNGVILSLFENGGVRLSRDIQRSLESLLKHQDFNRCSGGDCQSVSVMKSMNDMYISALCQQFDSPAKGVKASFITANPLIKEALSEVSNRLGIAEDADGILFNINNNGTNLTVIENERKISFEKLLALEAYDTMRSGNDVALSWEAPEVIASLARSLGRRMYRVGSDGFASAQSPAKKICEKQLWSRDALFLAVRLLSLSVSEQKSLFDLLGELPDFYLAKKVIEIDVSPAMISKRLLDGDFVLAQGDGIAHASKKGSARVCSDPRGKSLKIIAEAVSAEAAEELCIEIEEYIKNAATTQIE